MTMHVLGAVENHPRMSKPENIFAEVQVDPEIDTVDLLIRSNDGKFIRGVFFRSALIAALELPTAQPPVRFEQMQKPAPSSDLLGYAVVVMDIDLSTPMMFAAGPVKSAQVAGGYAAMSNLTAGERRDNRTRYVPVSIHALTQKPESGAGA